MFGGEKTRVELRCDNSLMKTIIDRFGEDVTTLAYDMKSFKVVVDIELSPTFYGWIFGFGGKIEILSPKKAKNEYCAMITEMYHNIVNK